MTAAESKILDTKIDGFITLMNAHFLVVNDRLSQIEEQTAGLNNRVVELENTVKLHPLDCPHMPEIRILQDNQLSTKAIKRWLLAGSAIFASVITVVVSVLKLIFHITI
jgi:hypothetical protein